MFASDSLGPKMWTFCENSALNFLSIGNYSDFSFWNGKLKKKKSTIFILRNKSYQFFFQPFDWISLHLTLLIFLLRYHPEWSAYARRVSVLRRAPFTPNRNNNIDFHNSSLLCHFFFSILLLRYFIAKVRCRIPENGKYSTTTIHSEPIKFVHLSMIT